MMSSTEVDSPVHVGMYRDNRFPECDSLQSLLQVTSSWPHQLRVESAADADHLRSLEIKFREVLLNKIQRL